MPPSSPTDTRKVSPIAGTFGPYRSRPTRESILIIGDDVARTRARDGLPRLRLLARSLRANLPQVSPMSRVVGNCVSNEAVRLPSRSKFETRTRRGNDTIGTFAHRDSCCGKCEDARNVFSHAMNFSRVSSESIAIVDRRLAEDVKGVEVSQIWRRNESWLDLLRSAVKIDRFVSLREAQSKPV